MFSLRVVRASAPILLAALLTSGCFTTTGEVEYATGQEYTSDDYRRLARQIAEDTAFNIIPGGSVLQFAYSMPQGSRDLLMETFRQRRDVAIRNSLLATGLDERALDAEADYYDNYIRCLAGNDAACNRVSALHANVREARARATTAREDAQRRLQQPTRVPARTPPADGAPGGHVGGH